MLILVTGGCGFLGSRIVERLVNEGDTVRVFDLPTANFHDITGLKDIEIFEGDVTIYKDVQKAIKGVEAIFHLAALKPWVSERNKQETMHINVEGTENVLESIKKEASKAQIIFPSTVSVYGIPAGHHDDPPISEEHSLSIKLEAYPYYVESKIGCEQLIQQSGIPYVILRITGVVDGESYQSVSGFAKSDHVKLRSNQRVEFIDRRDVVTAFEYSLKKEEAKNKIFNIAGGKTWQMLGKEFISKICEALGVATEKTYSDKLNTPLWYDTSYSQDILNYQHTSFDDFINDIRKWKDVDIWRRI